MIMVITIIRHWGNPWVYSPKYLFELLESCDPEINYNKEVGFNPPPSSYRG